MNLLSIFIHLLPSSFRPEPESALHIQPVALGSFNMDHWLFPDSHNYTHAWTTSSSVDLPLIEHVELDNDVLNAHHVGIPPDLDLAPNTSTKAWRAFYPRGGVNPHSDTPSGFGLYLDGPSNGFKERLASATEVSEYCSNLQLAKQRLQRSISDTASCFRKVGTGRKAESFLVSCRLLT